MRIGIDHRPALAHHPGVGRYARELVRALAALSGEDPGLELALLDAGLEPRALDPQALGLDVPGARIARRRVALPRRWLPALARCAGIDAARLLGDIDLFHHVRAPFAPVRRARQTLAVAELPAPGSEAERRLCAGLARMDALFAFSDAAASELVRRFAFPEDRVFRVSVGCDHWLRELGEPPPRAEPPEIVALGAVAARRKPLALLRAFEALAREGCAARLAFVGRPGDAARELEAALARSPARASVEWVREPREAELGPRLARASALAHLAEEEWTPVTPLEAFSLGTPVVASRLPAFEEALRGEAQLVANEELDADPTALVPHLARALASAALPEREAARRRVAARFPWRENALQTTAAWRRVLELGARSEPGAR